MSSAADVIDDRKLQASMSPKISSSAHLRKVKKPLIERRRRERINECLDQLKTLVLQATNRDESRFTKMEKADILEMVVAYMRSTRHHVTISNRSPSSLSPFSPCDVGGDDSSVSTTTTTTTPSDTNNNNNVGKDEVARADELYAAGFADCVRRVARFLSDYRARPSTSDSPAAAESCSIIAGCAAEMRLSGDYCATTSPGKYILACSLFPGSSDCSGSGSMRQTRTDDGRATERKLDEELLRRLVPLPQQQQQQQKQQHTVDAAVLTNNCDGNDLWQSLAMTSGFVQLHSPQTDPAGLLTTALWRPW